MNNRNTILIVEDDANSAYVLQQLLQKAGYDVLHIASNGETAYCMVEAQYPTLILMDISLAGDLDGIDTVLKIHQKYDIPVVYLTGHTSESIIKRAKETNPVGFILKPYTANRVLVTVEMAFHKAKIEKEAKEAKLRLAVTLGNLKNPIFSLRSDGGITYVNGAGLQFLGLPIGQVLNQNIDALLPILRPEPPYNPYASIFDLLPVGSSVLEHHVIFIDKTGFKRHLYIQISAVNTLHNVLQGYVVAVNDFSERFYADENNQRLATALKNSHEGILIVQKTGSVFSILYVNQGLLNGLKMTEDTLTGKPLSRLFCDEFNVDILQALQTQQPYTADTVVMCSDGTKKITSWSLSDTTEAGERVITIRDVTQLRKMEDNLRRSQKMEAVGRLAGGIAHDFNNLLSIINGCSDLALEALDQPNKMKDYLTSIKNAGEKGASLVRQLIEFSRHNHEMQGVVDKACATIESVKKTIQMLTYYLGEGVKLEVIITDNIWGIHILALHLDQILVNLAINARDAMPNGGVLKIKIDNFYGRPEGLNEGKFVKIVVEDCGIGMDTETQKKVFDPFFSTKPIGRGTGLGLSSVYGIVQQYKGAIQLESQLGCGTKFTLFFPACEPENLNTPMCADSAMVKRCCLNLEAQIAGNLKPLLLRQGWEICDKKMVNAIYISHDKQADVYVPRTFSEKTAVQHPLAFNQILHAMQNNRKGGE